MASETNAKVSTAGNAAKVTQEQSATTPPSRQLQPVSSRPQLADPAKPRNRGPRVATKKKRATAALVFSLCVVLLLGVDNIIFGGGTIESWRLWLIPLTLELGIADYVVSLSIALLVSWKMIFAGIDTKHPTVQDRGNVGTTCKLPKDAQSEVLGASHGGLERLARPRSTEEAGRWNQAIDSAARQGDSLKAGKLLLAFEKAGQPDVVSYNLVIRACAKKGNVQEAEKWLARMETRDIEPSICSYNTLLDACAKANEAEMCESWLKRMLEKGLEANVISYATAIYARARRGDVAVAEEWFQRMIDAGVEPDTVSYNSLIHACGVKGNAAGAEKWLEHMQERGILATVTTYTAVIDACAKVGDVQRGEKWLNQMIADNVEPNVVSFCTLVDACAKGNDLARAELWHDKMTERGIAPNAYTYSAVINACAKSGNVDAAERWLAKSEQTGAANDVVVYSGVIDACAKAGDAERALVVFRRMQAHGIRPHIVAYAGLARPFAYQGDWEKVESIAQEMRTQGINSNEYFLYAHLLSYSTSRPKQGERAEQCFRRAVALGINVNDHVVGALSRSVGRQHCQELMQELCNGREVPLPTQRRCENSGIGSRGGGRVGTR